MYISAVLINRHIRVLGRYAQNAHFALDKIGDLIKESRAFLSLSLSCSLLLFLSLSPCRAAARLPMKLLADSLCRQDPRTHCVEHVKL